MVIHCLEGWERLQGELGLLSSADFDPYLLFSYKKPHIFWLLKSYIFTEPRFCIGVLEK